MGAHPYKLNYSVIPKPQTKALYRNVSLHSIKLYCLIEVQTI